MAKVLVLGGAGFIGRHVCLALLGRGHEVVVGTRRPRRAGLRLPPALQRCERREAHLDWLTTAANWSALLRDVEVVVNAVGILRERGYETYERVHYRGPGALAAACRTKGIRLVHVSALGLHLEAASRFIRSKLWGESAVASAGGDYVLVRPSLLDGEDGFGARWLRRAARWPAHVVPANAAGRIAALHVDDLAEAIAALCDPTLRLPWREVELGGPVARPLDAYLATLRASANLGPARVLKLPGWLARLAAHVLDLLHVSPFSFGHYELLRRDNVPADNRLNFLLGRAPTPLGERAPRELSLPGVPARLPALPDAGGPASWAGP
jgi:NADH dehydrogenase